MCGLQQWDPSIAGSAEWYEASDHYLTAPFVDWLGWYHTSALRQLEGAVRTLLDIGCGDGRFVYAAAARGIDAHGIDHSKPLVALGNARFKGERLSITSIEGFHAAGQRFDSVTLFDVIEHVPDPLSLLRLCASLLPPGGRLIVSTPNRLGYPYGRHPMDRPPHHVTRWTPATLTFALQRAGFVDVRIALSPREVGMRAFLMDRLQLGLVSRALRAKRRDERALGATRSGAIGRAVFLKDRLLRVAAAILAPALGGRFAGGSMLASARRA